jgi:hypothetical protein
MGTRRPHQTRSDPSPDEFVVSDPYQCFTATDPAILDYKQKAWTDQIGVNPGS